MGQAIYNWIKAGLIQTEHEQQALEMAGERSNASSWLAFITKMLVLLGLLSLSFGVIFFFAYNWNDLGRAYKFLVLQVVLVAVFALYYFKAKSPWIAQALLLAGVLVLGALLALFGQTYQTGADPWQLFATWAVLISPLVLFSRSEVLWLVMAALINVALILYLHVNRSFFGFFFLGHHIPWLFLLLNSALVLVVEWLAGPNGKRLSWFALSHRWAAQVIGLAVMYILCLMGLEVVWGSSRSANLLLFVVFIAASFVFYRFIKHDLLLLTGWILALMIFVLSLLANAIFDDFDAGGLLLMAICLIGMSTFAVSWLKKTHLIFKQEQAS